MKATFALIAGLTLCTIPGAWAQTATSPAQTSPTVVPQSANTQSETVKSNLDQAQKKKPAAAPKADQPAEKK